VAPCTATRSPARPRHAAHCCLSLGDIRERIARLIRGIDFLLSWYCLGENGAMGSLPPGAMVSSSIPDRSGSSQTVSAFLLSTGTVHCRAQSASTWGQARQFLESRLPVRPKVSVSSGAQTANRNNKPGSSREDNEPSHWNKCWGKNQAGNKFGACRFKKNSNDGQREKIIHRIRIENSKESRRSDITPTRFRDAK